MLVLIPVRLVGTAWYFLDIGRPVSARCRVENREGSAPGLRDQAGQAANLDAYRAQLAEMQESFGAMLRQLPNRTEVADLLVDVRRPDWRQASSSSCSSRRPKCPSFYAELPIKIRVIGTYHEFGEFVSGLAALPRIVTIHDVEISRAPVTDRQLVMEATARTYRYLDEAGGMMRKFIPLVVPLLLAGVRIRT